MKIFKKLSVFVLCFALMAALCSCFNENPEFEEIPDKEMSEEREPSKENENVKPHPETTEPKEDIDALAETALEKMSVIPEYPEGYPTLDDVVAQYERANEAIGWIVGTELVATDADYTYEAHGMKYYKVLPDCYLGSMAAGKAPDADMLIYNKETLEAYIATLIHPEEAHDYVLDIEESFEVPRFIEGDDGALYALPYAFPAAGYGEENTYELTENDDGSYTLSVHYTTLDDNDEVKGEQVYKAKYVNLDGRWVFENFRVVKQH